MLEAKPKWRIVVEKEDIIDLQETADMDISGFISAVDVSVPLVLRRQLQ